MKSKLVLLGVLAALAAPVISAKADEPAKAKKRVKAQATATRSAAQAVDARRDRDTFYITNHVVTGSHLPVVVTRYQGHNINSSPLVSYDQTDISTTGALDVGSALVSRDPAISFVRH